MGTKRMNLFSIEKETSNIIELDKEFTAYQREVRNITLFDNTDKDITEDLAEELCSKYPNKSVIIRIDENYQVKLETFVDKETGYGMLNPSLVGNKNDIFLEIEPIYDGKVGKRELEFSVNTAIRDKENVKRKLGNKVKN